MTRELDSKAVYRALLALGAATSQQLSAQLLRSIAVSAPSAAFPPCDTPPSTPLQGINFLLGSGPIGAEPTKIRPPLGSFGAPVDDFAIPSSSYVRKVPSNVVSMDDFEIRYPERPHGSSTPRQSHESLANSSHILIDESSSEVSDSPMAVPSPTFHPWPGEEDEHSPKRRKISQSTNISWSRAHPRSPPRQGGAHSNNSLCVIDLDDDNGNDMMDLSEPASQSISEEGELRDDAGRRMYWNIDDRDRSKPQRRRTLLAEMDQSEPDDVVMSEASPEPNTSHGFSVFPPLWSSGDTTPQSRSSSISSNSSMLVDSGYDISFAPGPRLEPVRNVQLDPLKPLIILDAANVAFAMDSGQFRCEAIQRAGVYFQSKGYRVRCIIKEYFLMPRHRKGSRVDRPEYLRFLRDHGLLEPIQCDQHDDAYIIRYAMDAGAFIVSNDKFRDQPTYGNPHLNHYLQNGRISFKFMFSGKQFTAIWGDGAALPQVNV